MLGIKSVVLSALILCLVFFTLDIAAQEKGWKQYDGNCHRNRHSMMNVASPPLQRVWKDIVILPPVSALFKGSQQALYLMSISQNGAKYAKIDSKGAFNYLIDIPKDMGMGMLPPIMDENGNLFMSLYSKSNNQFLVMKSYLGSEKPIFNHVLNETSTINELTSLMCSDKSIFITSGTTLKSFNIENGQLEWSTTINNIDMSLASLFHKGKIYIQSGDGVYSIDPQNGKIIGFARTRTSSITQEIFVANDNLVIFVQQDGNYLAQVLNPDNISAGVMIYSYLTFKSGNIDLTQCTNSMSMPKQPHFYMKCNMDGAILMLRYDISNTSISFASQVDLNSLFGKNPNQCTDSIAGLGRNQFFVACDTGIYVFNADGSFDKKVALQIQMFYGTQVFGLLDGGIILSGDEKTTQYQVFNALNK